MYAHPPSPQIENLSQAKTAIPFVHHVARSRHIAMKLGLLVVAAVGLVVLSAWTRTRR